MRLSGLLRAAAVVCMAPVFVVAFAQAITTATFDLRGDVAHVLEYREFPGSTPRELVVERSFGPDGVITELVTFSYSFRDGSLSGRQVSSYDDGGRRQSIQAYDADGGLVGRTEYRYDAAGQQIAEVVTDVEGNETRRVDVERGADTLTQTTFRSGELVGRFDARLDAEGLRLEVMQYDAEGRLTQASTYTEPGVAYDYVRYDDDGEVEERGTVRQGDHGTEAVLSYDADGALIWDMVWTYDDAGLEIERRETDGDGNTITYLTLYTFDDRGNWIRRVQSEDFGSGPEPYEVRDRDITYR